MQFELMKATASLLLFAAFYVPQFFLHLVFNRPLQVLLSGDGCGQITDLQTHILIERCVFVGLAASLFFSGSISHSIISGFVGRTLFPLTILAASGFVVGGLVHVEFAEQILRCDVFPWGSHGPVANFLMAGLIFASALQTRFNFSKPRLGR